MSKAVDDVPTAPPELPAELHAALQLAFSQSLGSLDSLRITVRRFVQKQMRRGVSQGEIEAQMRHLMAEAELKAGDRQSALGIGELTRHVTKWTGAFFSATRV